MQQEAQIIKHDLSIGMDNWLVDPVAGSRKSIVLISSLVSVPPKKVLFLCFNKSIQEEQKTAGIATCKGSPQMKNIANRTKKGINYFILDVSLFTLSHFFISSSISIFAFFLIIHC